MICGVGFGMRQLLPLPRGFRARHPQVQVDLASKTA
jgi:DNA-binding transcriptional LysR family regulator